ncbi:MAG TPA: MlaD family protein [Steroidobacteraceae bacterium]|jgi:phospholipid/cholesterol/gamma-HCH transport system substrate-binding protein|nr:MlaD family protein [Steroidobacteraceae bacterium]
MENKAYTIGAGLFVLVLLVLLAGAILWFNNRGHLEGRLYDLVTRSSVAGLTVGATVSLRGVQIGEVQSIQFEHDDPTRIRVRVRVDPKFQLRQGTYATLSFQGLTGDAYVELDFPNEAREALAGSALNPAQIPMRPSAWAQLPDSGERFLTSFTDTLGRVDSILTPDNAQRLSRVLVNFAAAAEQIEAVARDLRPAAKRSAVLATDADETLRAAHQAMVDADSLVVDVHGHIGVLDEVGEGARQTGLSVRNVEEALVGSSLPKVDSLLDGLSQNSETLEELLKQIKQQPQSVVFGDRLPPLGPGESVERTWPVKP